MILLISTPEDRRCFRPAARWRAQWGISLTLRSKRGLKGAVTCLHIAAFVAPGELHCFGRQYFLTARIARALRAPPAQAAGATVLPTGCAILSARFG